MCGYFKRQTGEISHRKTWTWLRKGKLKRETESLLIATQINAIRTNNVKAKIDNKQQNSKFRFCGDRNKTINHISECSKLMQRLNTTKWEIWSTGNRARNWNLTRILRRVLENWGDLLSHKLQGKSISYLWRENTHKKKKTKQMCGYFER